MPRSTIRYVLFDLDNTLYPRSSGVLQRIDQRIEAFLRERFPLPDDELREMRRGYWRKYGTTLGGLVAEHGLAPEEYLSYIHDVPIEEMLQPDPALDRLLAEIPAPKGVFTNSIRSHAERVLRALGVTRHFGPIFDLEFMGLETKPQPNAFRAVLGALDLPPATCLFVDDTANNVRTARQLGLRTVQVLDGGDDGNATLEGEFVIPRTHLLGEILMYFHFVNAEGSQAR